MLLLIKSSFILKKVFINIDNKRKLNLIIYNTQLQKKLGLDIIDYRRFSGKYKRENNGFLRIYNSYDDRLLFEGQSLNGKRNGEGKEYDLKGNIIFEGEYLDDKKWKGFEMIYDEDNNNILFKYEYSNLLN